MSSVSDLLGMGRVPPPNAIPGHQLRLNQILGVGSRNLH